MIDHLRSDDILLYASDYPHWQFDGDEPCRRDYPPRCIAKILVDNPLATYDRLRSGHEPCRVGRHRFCSARASIVRRVHAKIAPQRLCHSYAVAAEPLKEQPP